MDGYTGKYLLKYLRCIDRLRLYKNVEDTMNTEWKKLMWVLCLTALCTTLILADDIALTVYNSNLGVVLEKRDLTFTEGTGRIGFTDVPSQIDATSVTFELADASKSVDILEQNYAYDLVSPDKIYSKFIDHTIEIITEKGDLFSGVLLSYSGGYLVIKQADSKIRSILTGTVRDVTFPELPDGLITRPTLFWKYISDFTGGATAKVGYQTTGIKWQAEYVGVLSEDEKTLDLTGWVSLDNKSGKTYKDATLKVVAGDVNRVRPEIRGGRTMDLLSMETSLAKAPTGFQEKAFFEYHLYTLPRKATVANNEIKQITMFEPAKAEVEKELRYYATQGNKKVNISLNMKNSEEVGLGMPLPAGRARIFKADTDESLILLGEDRITHTARNEKLKLKIGDAFDVVGETTEVSRRRISDKVTEFDYRIEVRNQKDEPARIIVDRGMGGFWEITNTSVDYVKKSSQKVEWTLDIPAEDKGVIDFTVRITYR